MDIIWALGMMSGTSMDGIDAALLSTDGQRVENFGQSFYQAYDYAARGLIQDAIKGVQSLPTDVLRAPDAWPDFLTQAQDFITDRHIELLHTLDVRPDVVGIHGQTLVHRPDEQFSLQILDGQRVARETGLNVVYDMRADDLKQGGQGAPLVPFYHFALAKRAGLAGPMAFLNVGGVSNVTWINPECKTPEDDGALLAFDTGTGMALLNDWIQAKTGQPYDADGALTAQGTVDALQVQQWGQTAYFEQSPPKSLDRDELKRLVDVSHMDIADGAATLAAFSAYGVERALEWMPAPPVVWYVCGGGRHNTALMTMLRDRLQTDVQPIDALGLDGDQIEAQAFGYLAVRRLNGDALTSPATTGRKDKDIVKTSSYAYGR